MEYNILRDWLSNHQFTWEKLGDILTYHHNAPILFSSGLFFFLFIGFLMIYMSLRKHTLARIIYVARFVHGFAAALLDLAQQVVIA